MYSDDPQRVPKEAVRVLNDGGVVRIGAEHYPERQGAPSPERAAAGLGYAIGASALVPRSAISTFFAVM